MLGAPSEPTRQLPVTCMQLLRSMLLYHTGSLETCHKHHSHCVLWLYSSMPAAQGYCPSLRWPTATVLACITHALQLHTATMPSETMHSAT